jgi:mannose-6-phosphate isomerase-like protein (cupin superfamily)
VDLEPDTVRYMAEPVRETVEGGGYAVGHLDGLGEGWGFRKVRSGLGITEFGVNAIVLPPGYAAGWHKHERQEELYFVHRGRVAIEFGDGTEHVLDEGGLARVEPDEARRVRNLDESSESVLLAIGAAGGYVGRDGVQVKGEDPRPAV